MVEKQHLMEKFHRVLLMALLEMFMVSLNKCTENCNVFYPKICVPKETKDILTNYMKAL